MFLGILIIGTLISISANSWLRAWIGLEINLLAFIPLIRDNKLISTESSLKYFLTQALASAVLLFRVILYILNSNKINSYHIIEIIIFSSLLLKRGSAPFHFWFPNVIEGLSWLNSLILITWQKIAPLILISYIIIKPIIIIRIILSRIIGALGGLNQTSLRKLIAYSSINHLRWILAAIYRRNSIWIIYFLFYSFLTFRIIFLFNLIKISHINQLFTLYLNSKITKIFIFLNLLSLGGLPPFLGFFPKWIVIQHLVINNQLFLLTFMLIITLITLYFYLRLSYRAFILNYYENNWIFNYLYNLISFKNLIIFSYISTLGFFITSSLYFLF